MPRLFNDSVASELLSEATESLNSLGTRAKDISLYYAYLADKYIELNDVKMASKLLSKCLQLSKSLKGKELVACLLYAGERYTKGKIRVNDADKKILHNLLYNSIKQSEAEG